MFGSTGSIGSAVYSIWSSIYTFATSTAFFKYIFGLGLWALDQTCGLDCIAQRFPDYVNYLTWFIILIFAMLPALFIIFLYISCLLYHIYCNKREVLQDVRHDMVQRDWRSACRRITAAMWYATSRIWNGYQIVYHPKALEILKSSSPGSRHSSAGTRSEPRLEREDTSDSGGVRRRTTSSANALLQPTPGPEIPVMIVYYHGALPVDLYYFVMHNVLASDMRPIYPSVDRFLFKVPGFSSALKFWNCIPGPRDKIIEALVNGNVVILSPGGTREAVFSKNYQLVWGKRTGFAECILAAQRDSPTGQVAVIPMFSKNCRSMFDFPDFCKGKWVRWFYDKTRWPIYPLCGGMPVKMTTYLGQPLILTTSKTWNALDLTQEIKRRLKSMIKNYQEVDSESAEERYGFLRSMLAGIIQRFQRVRQDFIDFDFQRFQRARTTSDAQ